MRKFNEINKNSTKFKQFDEFLNKGKGLNPKKKEFKQILNSNKVNIKKKFKTKTQFFKYFDSITLEKLIEEKKKDPDKYLEKNLIYYLITPLIIATCPKGTKFYRIMNYDEKFNQRYFESNPNPGYMRFNKPGERMLYVSTCTNVCIKECEKNRDDRFFLLEYKTKDNLKICFIGDNKKELSQKEIRDSYFKYAQNFFLKLIFKDKTSFNNKYCEKEYYKVIQDLKENIERDRSDKIDGFGKISNYKGCFNPDCPNHSIAIKHESESKLSHENSVKLCYLDSDNIMKCDKKKIEISE